MRILFGIAVLTLSTAVMAGSLLTRDELAAESSPGAAARIQGLLVPESVHGDLAATQKTLVLQRLPRIQKQLENPRRQEFALERHLRSVNEILATSRTSAGSDVYCRRQATGSNRVQVVCYDREEVEEKAEETRDSFQRHTACVEGICVDGG